jgi:Trk K+ transport system NAD-binding subunit
VELKVAAGSPAAGRSVSELANDAAFPPSCVIAGITQDREVQAPRGATVIQPGAELLVVAARADLTRTIAMFLGPSSGSAM